MNYRINATYLAHTDKYVASISTETTDFIIQAQNGEDLPGLVKNRTGVEIEYIKSSRTFIVPDENKF